MERQADRRHRLVADTSDEEEAYLPSDAEADIPMKQRLHSVDLFREMSKMPPEYPPEPEPYDPDAHRTVADMATDDEEELPDDPTAMDEELITDTKPFITDVYNQTAGVRRKARPSSFPLDMRHGQGQTQVLGEQEGEGSGQTEAGQPSAGGGPEHGAGRSASDVPSASEGRSGQAKEGGSGGSPDDLARQQAMEQLGGSDRIPPGGSTFLDKDAVLRRQEGKP
ncbi:hypothetical protein ABPG77_001238 [Micractinium sp. CCAP 211/92]